VALNATPYATPVGSVAGFANLVPKPDPDQGYADTKGVDECATAISEPLGLNETLLPFPTGSVAGFAYLEPKPEPLHG
jgi:hypothetical protein